MEKEADIEEINASDMEVAAEEAAGGDNVSMLSLEVAYDEAYESSADEAKDGENAPEEVSRQRGAASARIRRLFGLDMDRMPTRPLIQDDSNYARRLYWTCVEDSGFPNRVNHAVAAHRDAHGDWYCYSFGGYHADDDERTVIQADSQGGPFFKSSPIDVHVCDVSTRTWTRLDPPPKEKYFNVEPFQRAQQVPGCRYGHTVCSYQGRIYMYGGRNDEDGSFSNVDCYDIANNIWIKLTCSGDLPSSRDGHACTSIGPNMYIHGGFSASDIKFSGETFVFNMETHIWTRLPRKGYYVPERDFHTATAVQGPKNKKLVVFGGRSDKFYPYFTANDNYDNQFYSYNIDTYKWKKRTVVGYRVKGRRSHCAVNIGYNVLFFGGYNAVHKQHFGDIFMVNTENWHITEIRPFGDNPSPRRRVGCALVGDEIMICGGTSPVMIVKDGKEREILHDHNEVYILHLIPTLQQLCMMAVIRMDLSFDSLPFVMQKDIQEQLGKKLITITGRPVLPES